jgi:hypothetical protein
MTHIKSVAVIKDGNKVVCLPRTALDQLGRILKTLGRDPHSVIGLTCWCVGVGRNLQQLRCRNSAARTAPIRGCPCSRVWMALLQKSKVQAGVHPRF